MDKTYYVIKFGEMYLKKRGLDEYATAGETVLLTLTNDMYNAERHDGVTKEMLEMYLSLGASIHEISFYTMDKTYSLERDLIKDDE